MMDETTGYTCVVLHVDLDCFYAAVEHVRLSIPKDQPLAVQQWDGLIAVNYAARAAGIARHERAGEALRKVGIPEFVFHHAATRDEKQLSGFVLI
jgi:DNA polymerase eta